MGGSPPSRRGPPLKPNAGGSLARSHPGIRITVRITDFPTPSGNGEGEGGKGRKPGPHLKELKQLPLTCTRNINRGNCVAYRLRHEIYEVIVSLGRVVVLGSEKGKRLVALLKSM